MTDPHPHLVQTLGEDIERLVDDRGAGHCVVVPHLPSELADATAQQLYERLSDQDELYVRTVTPRPSPPWQATPTKAVQLRNHVEQTGGKLVLFVPSGQHLPAEDSFGEATFEVYTVEDLERRTTRALQAELERLDASLSEEAERVLSALEDDAFAVDDGQRVAYLARLVDRPRREEIGRGLTEFGLLPDVAAVSHDDDSLRSRLHRNLQQMRTLSEAAPPEERVRSLPLDRDRDETPGIVEALLETTREAGTDRGAIAARLRESGRDSAVDFGDWHLDTTAIKFDEFRVVQLVGDFSKGVDRTVTKPNASIGVRVATRPPASNLTGLKELVLELMRVGDGLDDLAETGVQAARRGNRLPGRPSSEWKLRVPTQDPEIGEGIYRFRVRAFNEDNLEVARAESEPFTVGEVEAPRRRIAQVPSIAAAVVAAVAEEDGDVAQEMPTLEASGDEDGRSAVRLSVAIRFEQTAKFWELSISNQLAQLERYTLDDPDSLGLYTIEIDGDEVGSRPAPAVPEGFASARARAFDEVRAAQRDLGGGVDPRPLVALADLAGVSEAVDEYLAQWRSALASAGTDEDRRTLLAVDQVAVTDGRTEIGRLVGPTHPLRLAWMTRYQSHVDRRLAASVDGVEAESIAAFLDVLRPANIPYVVVGDREPLRYLEALDLGWGLWGPASGRAASVLSARVRPWLFGESSSAASVSAADLVTRIRRYLTAHPFVDLLLLNFVQPGAARVVLEALLALQREPVFEHLRYIVRLFATELSRSELGAAIDDFMTDPEAARTVRRDEADVFLAASDDPLAPKLTYSKHDVSDLLLEPDAFPAHLTFFLDWFDLKVVAAAPAGDRRSFFGRGLLVEPVVAFRTGHQRMNPQWDGFVTGADPGDSFEAAFAAADEATARVLGGEESALVPAVRLDLDRVRRSVLDAVHDSSDWVVVVDPVFSDELFDTPGPEGGPQRYLIDYVGDENLDSARRIVVSTRSRRELRGLLAPITAAYGLEVTDDRVDSLLDALQVLGAGLPLKLLNNRTQAFEAFSLALASLYLAEQGVFRRALAVPLDLHQNLFREHAAGGDTDTTLRRTDIALVRVQEETAAPGIRFAVRLVEVKARTELPEQTPPALIAEVSDQLERSRAALRSALFGADRSSAQRAFEGTLQVRRLARLLVHYAERASRYGYLGGDDLAQVRRAARRLGGEAYGITFEKQALLFDLTGPTHVPERIDDVTVTRVGRVDVEEMLARARTRLGTQPFGGTPIPVRAAREEAADASRDDQPVVVETDPGSSAAVEGEEELVGPADTGDLGRQPTVEREDEAAGERPEPEGVEAEGPEPADVLLVGSTESSRQFGIVGRLRGAGTPVAVDLDGANTICVFGAPGSGKSYTVGAVLEAALMPEPALNRLPRPLAAVVFHYSDDQSYAPEFVSMGDANDDSDEVEALLRTYGAAPAALADVRVLAPEALVERRQQELPGLAVHPLRLASQEIGLNDWQLLMGLTGNDQMYSRAMNRLFATIRDDVTLARIRDAVGTSSLTQAQKGLALARLDFAASYVGDVPPVTEHLLPGRLLVVDLRDQLIAHDEALALFIVLLRAFGQVERDEAFNKLFVFDEAHKYMREAQLRSAIDGAVRERRHRGTTIVVASQDPPSVPAEIVGLANVLVAHKFTVNAWLDYVRRVKVAFAESDLKHSQLANLSTGEAFVWSEGGADEFRRPQRVQMRPRLTRHGGGTRFAIR